MLILSGEARAAEQAGGLVVIVGGYGSNANANGGGQGGGVFLCSGEARGLNAAGDVGGHVRVCGGVAAATSGGDLRIVSGHGQSTSSGLCTIATAEAGSSGASGSCIVSTGIATLGDSGALMAKSGTAVSGNGGDIDIIVGNGDLGNGGNVHICAGETRGERMQGGLVCFLGGHGTAESEIRGGMGGNVEMNGGIASGDASTDVGGCLCMEAGLAASSSGGNVILAAGFGSLTSSGSLRLVTTNAGHSGVSGSMQVATGTAAYGNSGKFTASSGNASTGASGDIDLLVGDTSCFNAADLTCHAGSVEGEGEGKGGSIGGSVVFCSGESERTSSGTVSLTSPCAVGASGFISFTTQTSDVGYSGSLDVKTGDVTSQGRGGTISSIIGTAASKGGCITCTAGDTQAQSSDGGSILLKSGHGLNTDGGNGGKFMAAAGQTNGEEAVGGAVSIIAGISRKSYGGSVLVASGSSDVNSSGNMGLVTANSGTPGESGAVEIFTGSGTCGDSGQINTMTGSTVRGSSASLDLVSGNGFATHGGDLVLYAGMITGSEQGARSGGLVAIQSGYSESTSSGSVMVATSDSSAFGMSGSLAVATGGGVCGSSGIINFGTGNSIEHSQSGGDINFAVGTAKKDAFGGELRIAAGASKSKVGGTVSIHSGKGFYSGPVSIKTPNVSEGGACSGQVLLKSGCTHLEKSGSIYVSTGSACLVNDGFAGGIELSVGTAACHSSAGSILLNAGDSIDTYAAGDISLFAGCAESSPGGNLTFHAGNSNANQILRGNVTVNSGPSWHGVGGCCKYKTGSSVDDETGVIQMSTPTASTAHSGGIVVCTGDSRAKSHGIGIRSGIAAASAGRINLKIGAAAGVGQGGSIALAAGSAENSASRGGAITFLTGGSSQVCGALQ